MKPILYILLILSVLSIQCKPEKKEIPEKEFKETQNSPINTKLRKQYKSLENKITDFERARIYTDISSLHSTKGNIKAAIKSAHEAIKYQPNQYMSYYLLGKSLIEAARYDEAIIQLNESINLNDKFAPAHFEIANAYYKKFKYKQALKEYQITVKLDKNHYRAYNNIGVLYNLFKKPGTAEKNFKQARNIKPDFAPVYRNLGILYDLKLKKSELAILNYEKYLEYMPNSPQRKNVRYWINILKGK